MRWLALVTLLAGCAELGVVGDGTTISVGKPNRGFLIDGVRIPDSGEGFVTRAVWQSRGNRFGTDELVDLLTAVARRMQAHGDGARLVVADLSGQGGGERRAFHRSHQSGRDVDLLYYMRDAQGQPFEPDAMHAFNAWGRATDGSRISVDVPRTWLVVKELITAPEAVVQYVFMYEPIAWLLIEHAREIGEPEEIIARARRMVRQPGDSARHDDHFHVRVYCAAADRAYGCVDIGPMEMLAERQHEPSQLHDLLAALAPGSAGAVPGSTTAAPTPIAAASPSLGIPAGPVEEAAAAGALSASRVFGASAALHPAGALNTSAPSAGTAPPPMSLGRLFRTRLDRISLRRWR